MDKMVVVVTDMLSNYHDLSIEDKIDGVYGPFDNKQQIDSFIDQYRKANPGSELTYLVVKLQSPEFA